MREEGKIKWAMCEPKFYQVSYVINPWMQNHIGVTRSEVARQQWHALYTLLAEHEVVDLIPPVPDLPDLVFTANAGLVIDHTFILSRFRYPERQREEPFFYDWFKERNYDVITLESDLYFEGEGDALFQPNERLLWLGYGFRTAKEVAPVLQELTNVEVIPLHLINQHFYHLDTCFTPLPGGHVIYYPPAFDEVSLHHIYERIPASHRIEIDQPNASHFACNMIICGNKVLSNFISDDLKQKLIACGLTPYTVPLSEFMLAGGAAKCLALKLNQDIPITK